MINKRNLPGAHNGLLAARQGPQGTLTFLWDGADMLSADGGSGTGSGTGGVQVLVQGGMLLRAIGLKPDGTPLNRQFHLDPQGSVLAITDGNAE